MSSFTSQCEPFRVLSIDGGGAKGIYALGVLEEVEALTGRPLCKDFHLIYGTSTGAIIATSLALGMSVQEIMGAYLDCMQAIMGKPFACQRSQALSIYLSERFGNQDFTDVQTDIGIVTTDFDDERPVIFKSNKNLAHYGKSSFVPGWGASLADAVEASCSAYPYFRLKELELVGRGKVKLMDGGFVANNPAFFALVDAKEALDLTDETVRFLSVGVGNYKEGKAWQQFSGMQYFLSKDLLNKFFNFNSNTIDQLFTLFSKKNTVVRVNEAFLQFNVSMFETDRGKLERLRRHGRDSFRLYESSIRELLSLPTAD